MPILVERDIDFLAAKLHGWRSRLAEDERLDELSRIRTVAELARRIAPEGSFRDAAPLQRHLIEAHVRELGGLAIAVGGPAGALLNWQRTRFQAENLKVLARGAARRMPLDSLTSRLIALPEDLALDLAPYADRPDDETLAAWLRRFLPPGSPLRKALEQDDEAFREATEPFLAEAALDRAYLLLLLRHARAVRGEDGDGVRRLVRHEIAIFNTMLAMRGRHHYQLPPELLGAAFVPGGSLERATFDKAIACEEQAAAFRLLAAPLDPQGAAVAQPEASVLETMAWNRYLRLANALFRQSRMSIGVAVGFAAIRRIELANLITLCEGMRMGMEPFRLRQRLIPRSILEDAHV